MTPETTPSSSGSDSSRPSLKSADERLMVAVRIRPLKPDESQRVLYAVNKKVRCARGDKVFKFSTEHTFKYHSETAKTFLS